MNRRAFAGWVLFAAALVFAPLLVGGSLGLSLLSQTAIAIVACLSFNILLGQGGMLSFGHAVYSGLGGFAAIHALRAVGSGALPLPVSLVPLVGGVAGLGCAAVLGFVTTRRSGTGFAMITLGLGELVVTLVLMLPAVFGGEAGITANRVAGRAFSGIDFGPQVQVYGLLAAYAFVSTAAMFAFTRTPLGLLLNAVRDNPQRLPFIGHDPQRVRWLAFMVAGFFAGIAGGMAVLDSEIVTAEAVGAARSAGLLMFTVLGGTAVFCGPIVGAVLMVVATMLWPVLTRAWLLYLGVLFIGAVVVAPGGIAGALGTLWRVAAAGRLREWAGIALVPMAAAVPGALGVAALIEMVYRLHDEGLGPVLPFFGVGLDPRAASSWWCAAALVAAGTVSTVLAWRRVADRWRALQQALGGVSSPCTPTR